MCIRHSCEDLWRWPDLDQFPRELHGMASYTGSWIRSPNSSSFTTSDVPHLRVPRQHPRLPVKMYLGTCPKPGRVPSTPMDGSIATTYQVEIHQSWSRLPNPSRRIFDFPLVIELFEIRPRRLDPKQQSR